MNTSSSVIRTSANAVAGEIDEAQVGIAPVRHGQRTESAKARPTRVESPLVEARDRRRQIDEIEIAVARDIHELLASAAECGERRPVRDRFDRSETALAEIRLVEPGDCLAPSERPRFPRHRDRASDNQRHRCRRAGWRGSQDRRPRAVIREMRDPRAGSLCRRDRAAAANASDSGRLPDACGRIARPASRRSRSAFRDSGRRWSGPDRMRCPIPPESDGTSAPGGTAGRCGSRSRSDRRRRDPCAPASPGNRLGEACEKTRPCFVRVSLPDSVPRRSRRRPRTSIARHRDRAARDGSGGSSAFQDRGGAAGDCRSGSASDSGSRSACGCARWASVRSTPLSFSAA